MIVHGLLGLQGVDFILRLDLLFLFLLLLLNRDYMREIPSSRCLRDHASTSYSFFSWINALGFNGHGHDDGNREVAWLAYGKREKAHLMEEAYCDVTKQEKTAYLSFPSSPSWNWMKYGMYCV